MRKIITALLLVFTCSSSSVYASGIPVIDAASIAESVKMLAEAQKQLKELQEQVATAKSQLEDFRKEAEETKKRLEGFTDFGNIFDSSTAYLKDTLKDIQGDLSDADYYDWQAKQKIETEKGSGLEAEYQRRAAKIHHYEKMQDNLTVQSAKLDSLQREFKDATTPQKREEVLNTIQLENLKMQNTMKAVEFEIKKQEQEDAVAEKEALKKHMAEQMESPKITGYFSLD
ncbi:type IV secretion system protein [Morganella morganii]|uniref:type IV secretion system protein n=1 Tax=Morganella morganii TaxID=582 RepID=UPI002FE62004